ncbi:MAG: DUF6094 domain-containing protein [Gammaproteobacteria bacterium]|nr:DUF6094 domain-containing protein [Gammaproteobacteria bacterium]MDH5652993.1 DUF6094 domain-containing protein [Gammaproteobacteria bacterium]
MALMFQRLARNFIKNGYFPTDSETTARVLSALIPATSGTLRILDPCVGEGVALAECKHHLDDHRVQTFGVEYDLERAWHAKEILDHCIHGDIQDCNLGQRQFGLVWLNPPYGDLVADKGSTGDRLGGKGRKRLEKLFYRMSFPALQYGGIMVLIIPRYSLDKELAIWFTTHFQRIQVFDAPEQRFKQIVLFGVRCHTQDTPVRNDKIRQHLIAIGLGEQEAAILPEVWEETPYVVPAAPGGEVKFHYAKLDTAQLQAEIQRHRCLWDQFDLKFRHPALEHHRRPLCQLSNWHLALALAAGQVSDVVHSKDGRMFLIKGGTHKEKLREAKSEIQADDSVVNTTVLTDKFVPTIRAIDFTPGPEFSRVIEIK